MVQFLIESHNEDINILASSGMPVYKEDDNLGNLESIRLLLEKGGVEQIYKTNLNGDNALHTASYFNDIEVLEFLLEHGSDANIDNVTAEGLTALHLACNRGQLDAVKLLMQHNADVNKENGKYRTPFHQAVAVGNLDIVKYLYENYDIQWTSTKEGLSSYSLAIVKQQPHIFDYLFENSKINATAVDLIVAVETNQLEIVEKLLKANVSQETTQMNILHVAANTGEIKMMKLLFEYGGKNNLNKVNNNGLTPLHVACLSSNANLEVVQCLLDHGANIDIVDIDTNPLHCAVLKGNFDIVKVLALSHKPQELDYKNVLRTALRTATELGRTEIAQFLSGILKHKGN
jgi:ankyrin repeat protein